MAKLTGQTGLTLATALANLGSAGLADGNVWIDYTGKLIYVAKQGALDDGGVSLQALYSFVMKQWLDNDFEMYKFPMYSVTPGEFELQLGWDFADDTTRYLLRDAGWNLLNSSTSVIEEVWMGFKTLGTIDAPLSDQVYFIHTAVGTPTNFQLTGVVNQAVKIYGDATHGNFDYRLTSNSRFVVFLREQGKTYDSYDLNTAQDLTGLKNNVYAAPLGNGTDLDISASDAYVAFSAVEATGVDFTAATKTIATTDIDFTGLSVGDRIVISGSTLNDGTYTIATNADANTITVVEAIVDDLAETGVTISSIHQSMSITWGAITRDLGPGSKNYSILIDANFGTLKQIYEFVQWSLRQAVDIDDGGGTEVGRIKDAMLAFVGPTLKTRLTSDGGVFIDNIQIADKNSVVFVDDTGASNTYPYVAAGRINFNENLVADAGTAKYWMYFANAGGALYDTPSAIIVNDNGGTPITAVVPGIGYVDFDYDYEGNVQGARTPNEDAAIILIAIGSNNAKYVSATGTLTKSTLMSFTLTAEKERNYVA